VMKYNFDTPVQLWGLFCSQRELWERLVSLSMLSKLSAHFQLSGPTANCEDMKYLCKDDSTIFPISFLFSTQGTVRTTTLILYFRC